MSAGTLALRLAMVFAAWMHTFPARRHLALFVAHPSLDEAWKGFGALLAVALYLLPVKTVTSTLARAWRAAPRLLRTASLVLAFAHVVPAADHLPKLFASPSFADAWRAIGASLAAGWLALPFLVQMRLIAWVRSSFRRAPARRELTTVPR